MPKYLSRRTRLQRKTNIRRFNAKRQARERERQFGPLAEYIRGQPCDICAAPPPSDPAHVKARRNAGAWLEGPDGVRGNIVPLCRKHHQEQHWIGVRSFERRNSYDMVEAGRRWGESFLALDPGSDNG